MSNHFRGRDVPCSAPSCYLFSPKAAQRQGEACRQRSPTSERRSRRTGTMLPPACPCCSARSPPPSGTRRMVSSWGPSDLPALAGSQEGAGAWEGPERPSETVRFVRGSEEHDPEEGHDRSTPAHSDSRAARYSKRMDWMMPVISRSAFVHSPRACGCRPGGDRSVSAATTSRFPPTETIQTLIVSPNPRRGPGTRTLALGLRHRTPGEEVSRFAPAVLAHLQHDVSCRASANSGAQWTLHDADAGRPGHRRCERVLSIHRRPGPSRLLQGAASPPSGNVVQ